MGQWSRHPLSQQQVAAISGLSVVPALPDSFLPFLWGVFGVAGPRLLLGNCHLDITGVLQGCLRRERLRSFLEETHLQNYFKTGQWHPRETQIFQLSPGIVSKLRSNKRRSSTMAQPCKFQHLGNGGRRIRNLRTALATKTKDQTWVTGSGWPKICCKWQFSYSHIRGDKRISSCKCNCHFEYLFPCPESSYTRP